MARTRGNCLPSPALLRCWQGASSSRFAVVHRYTQRVTFSDHFSGKPPLDQVLAFTLGDLSNLPSLCVDNTGSLASCLHRIHSNLHSVLTGELYYGSLRTSLAARLHTHNFGGCTLAAPCWHGSQRRSCIIRQDLQQRHAWKHASWRATN
eukprot:3912453-Rhodomonas_salina.1